MVSASDFRKGVTFEKEGQPCLIVDFQHVKPGKGAAFVRTKYRNLKTGAIRENLKNRNNTIMPTITEFVNKFMQRKTNEFITIVHTVSIIYNFSV